MALPALKWRKLAPVTLAANNVNAALDALYAAGNAATYADGSPRVQGTDSAWRWSLNFDNTNALQPGATTAVWAYPPTAGYAPAAGTVVPQAIIWAGSTVLPTATPRYAYPAAQIDARTAGMLYIAQCKNPGSYSNWNSATPFTTGQFTGFANAVVAFATATWNLLYMWESPEAIIVQFARTAPQVNTSWSGAGALLDPSGSSVAETDGRLYGMFANGQNNYCSGSFWSSTTDIPFNEGSTAGRERFGVFEPGTATINGYNRFGVSSPTTALLSRGGEVPLLPVWCSSTLVPSRLREIWLTRDAYTNQSFTDGGTPTPVTLGYVVAGYFASTTVDAAILTV